MPSFGRTGYRRMCLATEGLDQSFQYRLGYSPLVFRFEKLTLAIIAVGLLNEYVLPFGDIHWTVRTICSSFICFWIDCSQAKDGTVATPISRSNQRMTFINELEIRRQGRLSIVSRRNVSFDGYGYHPVVKLTSGVSSLSSSSMK